MTPPEVGKAENMLGMAAEDLIEAPVSLQRGRPSCLGSAPDQPQRGLLPVSRAGSLGLRLMGVNCRKRFENIVVRFNNGSRCEGPK